MKNYRQACFYAFKQQYPGLAVAEQRVRIDVEYRCHRGVEGYQPTDFDNCVGSLKAGLDGLVDARAIWQDTKKWLEWGDVKLLTTKAHVEKTGKGPGVTITVKAAA